MTDMPNDITAAIAPEAANADLHGKRAVIRVFEYLRVNASRVSFFSAIYLLAETEAEQQLSFEGIQRAIGGVELALQLIKGRVPIAGIHPDNLAWFRALLDQRPGDREVFGKFAKYMVELSDPSSFEGGGLRQTIFKMIPFAATSFNEHCAGLLNLSATELEKERLAQQSRAVTATSEAQNAMAQIDWIAQSVRLISLNASVEAARAGDAGAGFGVIAEEIRRLSDEIGSASGDVRSGLTLLLQEIEA